MERGPIQMLLREAVTSAKAGNKSWARECLGRVLKAEPQNVEAWLWMSSVLDTPAEKRFCLEKVLAINPQNLQALAGLRWLDQQSRIPRAAAAPKRTLCPMCGEPNDPKAFQCANCGQDLFVLCPSCSERVDIDRPVCASCGLEVGDSSTGAAYFFGLAELYLQHGQPKRALETWDKTLFLNPDYPRVAEAAADAFLATGQRDLALQSLQRAIEESQDEEHKRDLRLKMANFHRDLGNLEEARKVYLELLQEEKERHESWTELYVELGRFYQRTGDTDEARNYYDMALTLDENLHEVRYLVAEILLEQGYELRALNEFQWLQEKGGEVAARAKTQVLAMRPPVPDEFRNRWQETLRGTARYVLGGLTLLALSTGRYWMNLAPRDLIGLLCSMLGGYLVTAATATPRNLPTLAMFSKLGDKPVLARMRLRPRQAAGEATPKKPSLLARFAASQRRSLQQLVAHLRIFTMRVGQSLHRLAVPIGKSWAKAKGSKAGQKVTQVVAAFAKTRFYQSIARSLRGMFPQQSGLFTRLKGLIRGGGQRLAEQAGKVEVTELGVFRWIAAVLGLFLLGLAVRLILV